MEELLNHEVEPSTLRLLSSYLCVREVAVQYAGCTVSMETNRGCIQGSTYGPLLWNVQVDPLHRAADRLNAHIQAFADDILVIASRGMTEKVRVNAQEAFEVIAEWGSAFKIRFAAHKTQEIITTRKFKATPPNLTLNGTQIGFRESLRVLGLTVVSRLNFREDLACAHQRAVALYKRVARKASAGYGLNSDVLKIIYQNVVERPVWFKCVG